MIIPQIAENLTESGNLEIPKYCPVCGRETEISKLNDAETLVCPNEDCEAKKIKAFTLMVSRDALNIDGLSEATLEKFIAKGFIHDFADIFHLDRYQEEITEMEGFGEKSYQNLMESLEKAKDATLAKFVYSLGINGIGLANAKMLCKAFRDDFERLKGASAEELAEIDGIGEVLAEGIRNFFDDEKKLASAERLLSELRIAKTEESEEEQIFLGKTFVITGSVEHFNNRNEVKELIERKGGKVAGSVSGKTDYLINNDLASASGKNKKAKELGVPIISEEMFLEMLDN